jgi:beta-xylosidase
MPAAPPGASVPRGLDVQDDFDGGQLAPQWISVRRPLTDRASLDKRPGWLTLRGGEGDLDSPWPTFVGRRQQAHLCQVRTSIEVDDATEAGLAILFDERHHYEVAVVGADVIVRARIVDLTAIVGRCGAPARRLVLRVDTRDDVAGQAGPAPDVVHLGIEDDDGLFEPLAKLDGRYLSTEVATGFSGRVIGLYAVGGAAHFDWFSVSITPAGTATSGSSPA